MEDLTHVCDTPAGARANFSRRSRYTCFGVALLVLLPVAWFTYMQLQYAIHYAAHAACAGNLRAVRTAMMAYCADYDGRLPLPLNWCDEVDARVDARYRAPDRKWYDCPRLRGDGCGYCLNAALAGLEIKAVGQPEITVLVFDGPAGWNLSGGPGDVDYRHEPFRKGAHCLLADWSLSYIKRDGSRPARWEP